MPTSIDGYIAGEQGELDWLESIPTEPGQDCGYGEFIKTIDLLIMGRNTYEKVLSFDKWPYEGIRVIVLSKSLKTAKNVELFSGDIHQLLDQVYAEGIRHVYIDGGKTVSSFLNAQLVDEMTLSIIPIILGAGIKLFDQIQSRHQWPLLNAKSYSNGLVQSHYSINS